MSEDRSVGEKVIYNPSTKYLFSSSLQVQLLVIPILFIYYALPTSKKEQWCHKPKDKSKVIKGMKQKWLF